MMRHAGNIRRERRKGHRNSGALGLVFTFIVFVLHASNVFGQGTPYPRLGAFTFSGNTEASLDILKEFDILAFVPGNEMAQKYKAQNPNMILLGTSGCMIGEEMSNLPEEWYYHKANGDRIPLWTDRYIMNMTSICPEVDLGDGHGPKTFLEHCIHTVERELDFNYFDGVFHDWWWGGPGMDAINGGDLDGNGIVDKEEWGVDSVNAVWRQGLLQFHELEYQIPGCEYVVVQIGTRWGIWPHINGACYEDWPIYNGPWITWYYQWNDQEVNTKDPKIMFFNSAISQFNNHFPTTPYKNNYRSVRFGLASCLMTEAYFYVDEGNQIGHHGNIHIYDEFEAKGQLGQPLTGNLQLQGKQKAGTNYAVGVFVRFFDHGVSVVNATGQQQTISASELAALDPVGGSHYFRIQGGQDPVFNNGEEVTDIDPLVLWGDITMANWSEEEVFGDGAMLFRTEKTYVTPIIVDNHENNQTSPGSDPVQYSGGWVYDSNGGKYYAYYTGRDYGPFQPDAFAWSPPGSGENVATYTPTIGVSGLYEVFEWHGYRGGSGGDYPLADDLPVHIVYGGARDTTFTINQTVNFGQWNSLGTYQFDVGTNGKVELINNTNGIAISDAIKFVYKGSSGIVDTVPPNAPQGVSVQRIQ